MRYVDEFRYVGRSYGPLFESDYDYESNESTEGNENDLMRAHESRAVERAGECASAQAQTGEQFADDLLVLKDIFSDMYLSEALDEDRKEKVVVIGGISRVRRDFSLPSEIGERKIGGGGRKEPVKTFSRKSRRNLMVKLAMMVIDFLFWQDFTFADDVMAGLSISQRAKYSTKVMKAFKE